jgi:hypothetical protein
MDGGIAENVRDKSEIWSMQAYILHNKAMRAANKAFHDERDRRYAEVNVEREKALKIKETADLAALSLARESQVYKDQQADVMREKNLAASGIYATNTDLQTIVQQLSQQQIAHAEKIENTLKPLIEFGYIASTRVLETGNLNIRMKNPQFLKSGTAVSLKECNYEMMRYKKQ